MDLISIGSRIKKCRKIRNFSQESLAEKIDVSPHYIYEIERGSKTMSIHTLTKVSEALDVSADYLLFGTQEQQDSPDDSLDVLLSQLSVSKRKHLAEILTALLPYLK